MSGSSANHFRALMKKNWIVWKRNKWCSTLEIVVPILFNLFLLLIRANVSIKNYNQTSYINQGYTLNPQVQPLVGLDIANKDLSGIEHGDSQRYNQYKKLLIQNVMKQCYCDPEDQDKCFPGIAALSPPGNPIIKDVEQKIQQLGIPTKYFDSNKDVDNYVRATQYKTGPFLCFAVVLEQSDPGQYKYLLRFNATTNEEVQLPDIQRVNHVLERDFDNFAKYLHKSGFLALQNWIDNAILRQETKNQDAFIKPTIISMPTKKFKQDDFPQNIRGTIAFFTVMPLILLLINFVSKLLYEKEKKIREGMKMMGMSNTSFYFSWILTYFIIILVVAILQSLILKAMVFKHTDFFIILVLYILFGICLIAQGFFIQVFFSRVMIGMIIAMVLFLVQYMFVEFASDTDTSYKSESTKTLLSFFPQVAITCGLNNLLEYEAGQTGVKWDTLGKKYQNFSVGISIGMMIFNALIFSLVGLYLDQVIPNEFGTKKHPLFFLGCKKRKKENNYKKVQNSVELNEAEISKEKELGIIEGVDAQLQQQEVNKETVSIQNLRKVFSNGTKAVNNISFSMYHNQISVLLGHNGAGKTTTISMLTGLLEISSGTAKVFDKSINNDMEEIRKFLGICPQHDILFDKLTVKEHLELFATFKGLSGKKVSEEVTKMIKDLDLVEKTDQESRTLSGGQKRRLSVGIAFIGNSKFVVLDEPTSGMDTSARRYIWDLLKNYKSGRVILLTTHFMDEADYLGDRITIMSGGKVKASGSSIFLKNRFGIGYNLVIVKNKQDKNQHLIDTVIKTIPQAILLSDVSSEITFQLPMETKNKFEELFEYFDANLQSLGIQTYGISITTLEEVFLKIAEIDTHDKMKDSVNIKEQIKKQMIESKLQKRNSIHQEAQEGELDHQIAFNRSKITLFGQHFKALIKKRFNYFKRDKKGLVCELFLPCLMILIGLAIMTRKLIADSKYLWIEAKMYDSKKLKVIYSPDIPDTTDIFNKFDQTSVSVQGFQAPSPAAWDDYVFSQKNDDLLGSYFFSQINQNKKQYELIVSCNTIAPESGIFFTNQINQAIISAASGNKVSILMAHAPMKVTKKFEKLNNSVNGIMASFYFTIAMAFIPASVIVYLIKEKMINAKHQQRVSGVTYFSYWLSNLMVDYVKYLLPCIFAPLMAIAFDVEALTKAKQKRWGAFWIIQILYGFALSNFTYLFTFIFDNHGTGQLSMFFLSFAFGAIIVMGIFIMKLIKSTRSIAKILQWICRLFPPFTYGYGLMNIANVELYGILDDDLADATAFNMDIAGADMIFLAFTSILYFFLVQFLEKIKNQKIFASLINKFNRVKETPYQMPDKMDSDVKKEILEVEQTPAKEYSIKVDKLRKIYSTGKVAVQQISFGIQNGDCFSLLGVNGAGKTTTFKMLCGEFPPTSGEAYLNGFDIKTQLGEAQKIMGYCPQFDALLELLTVREHLELYANIKGIVKQDISNSVKNIIKEMNLEKFEFICAGKLSGGNKRKLSVAIAMIGNPPIVFLDEPSTGMDPAARRFMWNVISRISTQRKQSSIVLTTHSMEEAEALSTKLGIMVNGEFKCMGSVQHIKNKFGKGYEIECKLLIQSQEQLEAELIKTKATSNTILTNIGQCESILQQLGKPEYAAFIKPTEAGSALYYQLENQKSMPIQMLIEFYLIEKKGDIIKSFLLKNFERYTLIEHYGAYFRFKLDSNISVGKLFGKFEAESANLDLANYSIKQATIEQIFNLFAEGKISVLEESNSNSNEIFVQSEDFLVQNQNQKKLSKEQ